MLSPIIILLLMLMAYYLSPWLIKQRKRLYVGVWFLLAIIIVLNQKPFMQPFVRGYVGFAIFYVVMITGALNPKHKLTKRLKSVRATYSIIGFVLLLAHPTFYALEVLNQTRAFPIYGVLAFVIMIPLFITSYMKVRVKMKPKTWQNLQNFAYISYALILVHLIVNASTTINRLLAIGLFIIYIGLKLNFISKKANKSITTELNKASI